MQSNFSYERRKYFQLSQAPQRQTGRFIQIIQGEEVSVHANVTLTMYLKCYTCYPHPEI